MHGKSNKMVPTDKVWRRLQLFFMASMFVRLCSVIQILWSSTFELWVTLVNINQSNLPNFQWHRFSCSIVSFQEAFRKSESRLLGLIVRSVKTMHWFVLTTYILEQKSSLRSALYHIVLEVCTILLRALFWVFLRKLKFGFVTYFLNLLTNEIWIQCSYYFQK